jgi:hypothetical protein
MATRARSATTTRTRQRDPEPEPEDTSAMNGERDYTVYADKPITSTMVAFADWLIDEVYDGELPEDMDEDTFRRAVSLGGSTRAYFQRSEYWNEDPRNPRNKPEEEDEPEPPARPQASRRRQAAAEAPATRTRRGRRAEPEPEPEDIEDEVDDEAEDNEPEAEEAPPPPPRRTGRNRSRQAAAPAEAETDSGAKPARSGRSSRRGSTRTAATTDGNPAAPF